MDWMRLTDDGRLSGNDSNDMLILNTYPKYLFCAEEMGGQKLISDSIIVKVNVWLHLWTVAQFVENYHI